MSKRAGGGGSRYKDLIEEHLGVANRKHLSVGLDVAATLQQ